MTSSMIGLQTSTVCNQNQFPLPLGIFMYSLAFSSQQVNGQIKAGELENGIRATTWYVCAQQDNRSQLRLLSFCNLYQYTCKLTYDELLLWQHKGACISLKSILVQEKTRFNSVNKAKLNIISGLPYGVLLENQCLLFIKFIKIVKSEQVLFSLKSLHY